MDPERVEQESDVVLGLVLIREAVAQSPDNAALFDTLAWALFANGQWEDALLAAEEALDKASADSKADYQGYADQLKRAVELAPR